MEEGSPRSKACSSPISFVQFPAEKFGALVTFHIHEKLNNTPTVKCILNVKLAGSDGHAHQFNFETFYNTYDAPTLGRHVRAL